MAIQTKYKGVTLTFDHVPSAKEMQDAHALVEGRRPQRRPPQESYPLSPAQQQIWFHEQAEPGTATYNVAVGFELDGPLDVRAFTAAIDGLVARHDVLRCSVVTRDGAPAIAVDAAAELRCPLIDLSHQSVERRTAEQVRRTDAMCRTPISLERAPLMRAELLKLGELSFVFLVVIHHLITDAQSVDLLVSELFERYDAALTGRAPALPELECSFTDAVLWQNARLESGALRPQQESQARRLAGELPTLDLFADFPRGVAARFEGTSAQRALGTELSRFVRGTGKKHGCTPYVVALAALSVVLSRYTGQKDIVIGSPFAGRTEPRLAPVLGLFMSMQPIRLDLSGRPTLAALLGRTREGVLEAQENQDYPLLHLLSDLAVEREPGRAPLFQTILTYEPPAAAGGPHAHGLTVRPLAVENTTAKFEVSFTFHGAADGALLSAEFRSDLFERATIDGLLLHWSRAIEQICSNPEAVADTVPLLSVSEREALTRGVNAEEALSAPVTSVHGLFEEAARARPDAVAIIQGDRCTTYGALDRRANVLARWLESQGIGPERLVVLLFDQGIDAVTAMLAVLKAGGAYLPLDPSDPAARLRSIALDSGATVALCQERHAAIAGEAGLAFRSVDAPAAADAQEDDRALENTTRADDLMNVLYTSGSTGAPKGVALTHRGVLRLVHRPNFIVLGPDEVALQLCPLNFDGATFEIWGMLANGGVLVIAEKSVVLSPRELGDLIRARGVTTLILTTPLLNRIIEDAPDALVGLRNVVFGGEIISKPHMRRALEHCAPGALVHTYGPTENSFTSCHYRIHEVRDDAWTIPIGQPVSNTEIYILDGEREPVPAGVVGEIYLSGQGLARGYVNDPVKTAASFVTNPFAHGTHTQLMYRTGDRGRRLRNGLVEFVGRTDNQVKIRSHRVELGEVEQALRKHPLVRECFVTVHIAHDGGKQLVAYFVPETSGSSAALLSADAMADVRASMRRLLPDYMVPAHFISLTALPLNPNGKVNRRALPSPERASSTHGDGRGTGSSEGSLEAKIQGVWKDVLGLAQVLVTDNFFDVGGHSLAIVKIQRGIEVATGVQLPIADFFQYPTIRDLAVRVAEVGGLSCTEARGAAPREERGPSLLIASSDEAIAIIGMSIRAPKSDGIEAYWDNLAAGRDCVTTFSPDEVDSATRRSFEGHGDAWVRATGILDDVFGFDAGFFGLTELEARRMDPQQRVLLECVADAMENAGLDLVGRGASVSFYAGASPSSYGAVDPNNVSGSESLVAEATTNAVFMATRISYKLNLKGESVMVDTLCSTSLVAVHLACASLLTGSADYALAGGVTIQTPQKTGYLYEPSFIFAPDGRCRAFDKDASGTVPGWGAGVVLLRRLSDALRDGDPIHAVIRGSAVNNDGCDKVGYYAPGTRGQSDVIARAQRRARISPDTISYIEAHGTGTKLGDPIEVSALTDVFRASTSRVGFCGIGSVKTSVGHLGNAAGVAGLIKAALALKHRFMPASLHFRSPNPNIDFARSPFYVTAEGQTWHAGSTPRRAGVSSYGIGGTNAHVVLEEAS